MPRSECPPPSKAAERLREYLDIFDAMEAKRARPYGMTSTDELGIPIKQIALSDTLKKMI